MERRSSFIMNFIKNFIKDKIRPAYLFLGLFALMIGLSLFWEGPRTVFSHAIVICLDCIGLI